MNLAKKRLIGASLAAASVVASLAGCATTNSAGTDGADGVLTLWTHNAGNQAELDAIEAIVTDYNASQDETTVEVQAFPQGSYNDSVVAAAAANKLPCIVDIDGPNVPNWAWAKYLAPLELSVDLEKHLPSTLGVWNDETYSVGYYDVALATFARKSVLDEAGIRVATMEEPWTAEEFDDALKTLKADGTWDYPLDLGTAGTGEWLPYAYSPFLQSFGGDLIDRSDFQSAEGVINGPEALAWAEWFQGVIDNEYAAAKSGTDSTLDFQNGQSAILYTGSWAATSTREVLGDDLVVMPTVDFGTGPKIGGGSWQWGISESCDAADGARAYLEFSFKPEYIAAFADKQVVIPATAEAEELSENFGEGDPLQPFVELSQRYALERPPTPAYPVISSVFERAAKDIMNGADVQSTLDQAVQEIDANIESNDGYGF